MQAPPVQQVHVAPSPKAARAIAELFVYDFDRDMPLLSIPRPEIHVVVRFGPSAKNGLDAHALGARERVHRKLLRKGQRAVTARLRLGAQESVLGVPAAEIVGRTVALEDLWGDGTTRRLFDRIACARDAIEAARILESAIEEHVATVDARRAHAALVLDAAERLASTNVNAVATDLGVSERHLRRVFREAVGVSPKAFARLARFRRAVRAAREEGGASWASIAAATGYYDQAHLIADFRAIAGVTPRALLGELRGGAPTS